MGLFGSPNVEKMKAKRDVDGLVKTLDYKKTESRNTKQKYHDYGKEQEYIKVRVAAVKALGEICDARTIEPLIAEFKDKDLREAAMDALVNVGNQGVEFLNTALKDNEWVVRRAAAETLGKIGDARAVEPLISVLKDKDWIARKKAAWALGQIRDARAIEPLVTMLEDENAEVHTTALSALAQFRDARLVEILIHALKDDDKNNRKTALAALGEIGDARAVDPLIAIAGKNPTARDALVKLST